MMALGFNPGGGGGGGGGDSGQDECSVLEDGDAAAAARTHHPRLHTVARGDASYDGGVMQASDENHPHPDFVAIYTPPPPGTQSSVLKPLPEEKSGDYHYAVAARDKLRDRFGQAWRADGLDAVVCPAFPCVAPRVEEVRELTWAIRTTQVGRWVVSPNHGGSGDGSSGCIKPHTPRFLLSPPLFPTPALLSC